MARTPVGICNSALVFVGSDGVINSFEDNTVEANLAFNVYEDVRDALLQFHPWRFSVKQINLGGKLVTDPLFKWKNQYQLPADLLRVISLMDEENYEIYGDKLYTDLNEVKMVYQYKVPEGKMPAYFVNALKFELARLFAISLQEDVNKMQLFEMAAKREITRARQIDSQQQPNAFISERNYSMINIRG